MGPVAASIGLFGLGRALARRTASDVVVGVFPVIWFVLVSVPQVHFAWNLLPMFPFITVVSAGELVRFSRALRTRGNVARALAYAAVVVPGFVLAVLGAGRLLQPDTRTIAYEWVVGNLPPGSRIVREGYTPQVRAPFDVGFVPAAWVRSIEWYGANGVQYVILSDTFRRYDSDEYPVQRDAYRRLFALPAVYADDGGAATNGPPIRIVAVP
jgi:hypothetical protein